MFRVTAYTFELWTRHETRVFSVTWMNRIYCFKYHLKKKKPYRSEFKFFFENREVKFKLLLFDVDLSRKPPWDGNRNFAL